MAKTRLAAPEPGAAPTPPPTVMDVLVTARTGVALIYQDQTHPPGTRLSQIPVELAERWIARGLATPVPLFEVAIRQHGILHGNRVLAPGDVVAVEEYRALHLHNSGAAVIREPATLPTPELATGPVPRPTPPPPKMARIRALSAGCLALEPDPDRPGQTRGRSLARGESTDCILETAARLIAEGAAEAVNLFEDLRILIAEYRRNLQGPATRGML